MSTPLPSAARRVQELLEAAGHPHEVQVLPDSARSAAEAASALGCDVAQIVKSIVFRGPTTGRSWWRPAARRVDEARLAAVVGELGRADAAFVKETTGYSIGGVSPFGLPPTAELLVDRSLVGIEPCWCAAGHPHAVVRCSVDDLLAASGRALVSVT